MKIKHLLTKTLLVAAGLLLGGANSVWGTAPTLTASYAVDNYAKLCYTNFVDETIDDGSTYADVFSWGDCGHRDDYGIQNTKSGNRAFTVTKDIQKGDLIIIQAGQTASYGMYVAASSALNNPIKNDGYYAFYVTANVSSFTITIGRNNYVSAMLILRPSNTNYTVNAVKADGTFLKEIATGTYSADGLIHYPVCVEKDGAYYRKNANGSDPYWSFTNVAAGLRTLIYEPVDYAYYSEIEDMSVSAALNNSAYSGTGRFSEGVAKRIPASGNAYTTALPAGKYSVTLYGRNNKNSEQGGLSVKLRRPDDSYTSTLGTFANWTSAQCAEKTITDIIVPEGYKIAICNHEWTSNIDQDYMYVVRTGDATVSKSITAAGWATYCSPYALDFSSAIANLDDAYIVTGGAGGVLSKTSVLGGTVPANTGLLLKGSEGTVNIPVAASSVTDVSANKLVGVTVDTPIDANAGYVLMASPSLAFYKNSNAFTVGANTAYLPVSFAPDAAPAFFSLDFDGETTGIADVRGKEDVRGNFFDLQGRKVAQPAKGLYIVNGKKVVIK